MANLVVFHEFKRYLGEQEVQLGTHTFKAALTNTAPTQGTDDTFSDITEIAAGNGYTAGGVTLAGVSFAETGAGTGVWRFTANDFSWTASGGAIATFRYVVVYDDSSTTPDDILVGYWDTGAAQSITDGNTFTGDIGANGILEIT